MKCENCNNTKPWLVWLIEKHADVYFVKFARWDKHVVCMCYVCEHGFEIEEHKLKAFFLNTWKYVEMIFNDLDRSDQKRMIAGFERVGLREEAKRLSEKRKKLF